ncbi:acanthoscurrin-2 [Drosophila nasuta]|uniref:acanthoscurrin-2 n=1 Tax=Drosophila nasuta TaxID=42062 RepID=UPI00295F4FA4|nr:acanthoscurrin-2 [Drosophila nasuta]
MRIFLLLVVALGLLALVCCHNPEEKKPYPYPKRGGGGRGGGRGGGSGGGGSGGGGSGGGGSGGGGSGGGGSGGGGSGGPSIESCPRPSPQSLKCLQEWACQQVIRLDLRCLLNLNGNNLLGNLVSIPGVTGGGTGGGILGGLLGK